MLVYVSPGITVTAYSAIATCLRLDECQHNNARTHNHKHRSSRGNDVRAREKDARNFELEVNAATGLVHLLPQNRHLLQTSPFVCETQIRIPVQRQYK